MSQSIYNNITANNSKIYTKVCGQQWQLVFNLGVCCCKDGDILMNKSHEKYDDAMF